MVKTRGKKDAEQGTSGGSQGGDRHLFNIKRKHAKTLQRKKEETRPKQRAKRSIKKWLKCDICPRRYFHGWAAIKRHKETYHCLPALFQNGYIEVFEEKTFSVNLGVRVKKVKIEKKMMNLKTGNFTRKNWTDALKTSIRYIIEKENVVRGASMTEIEYVLMLMYFKNFDYFRQKASAQLQRLIRKGIVGQRPDTDGYPLYFLVDEGEPNGPPVTKAVLQPEDADDDSDD
ncbi:unnamed protein product [Orchesella dallaii]|uniref:C2H2-type domain-containing protein n=1 Tax=Orchesella dallaii TaxID=48710 RepID=A0ABP1RW88_9HEXA